MEGESLASRGCHRREGERSWQLSSSGSGYSVGSARHANLLITSSLLTEAGVSRDLSLTVQRALSSGSVLWCHVATLPSHLDCEPPRGRDRALHSASAHGAHIVPGSAAAPADLPLATRLNQIFCSWTFSIYSMYDVI